VDPYTPFHSLVPDAGGSYENATDTIPDGYTPVPGWNASAAVKQHLDELTWLVVNGYRGSYDNDDEESNKSVARLQNMYMSSNADYAMGIDKNIAVMATKIAVWKILIGDELVLNKTNFTSAAYYPQPNNKNEILDWLVDRLVFDAQRKSTVADPSLTNLDMVILSNDVAPHSAETPDGNVYYGPFHVNASLKNPAVPEDFVMDDVFLSLSGENLGGVVLTDDDYNTLEYDRLYGTVESMQFLPGGPFGGNNKWTGDFYIKIPADRDDIKDLSVRAMARVQDVPLVGGTPLVFVFDRHGVHSWDAIQGFIGGSEEGAYTTLYAEALFEGEDFRGDIYIKKEVEHGTSADNNSEFTFRLLYSRSQDFDPSAVVSLTDYRIVGAFDVNTVNNTFTIKHGKSAVIESLPTTFYYKVEEIIPDSEKGDFEPSYSITLSSGQKVTGKGSITEAFQIDASKETSYATVLLSNKYPSTPGRPDEPDKPNRPGRPDKPDTPPKGPDRPDMPEEIGNGHVPLQPGDPPAIPQTGVSSMETNAAMLLLAMGMLAFVGILRKEK